MYLGMNTLGPQECAEQISEVLADIFSVSLCQAAVPACLKTAIIIPVPKSPAVTGLNDSADSPHAGSHKML